MRMLTFGGAGGVSGIMYQASSDATMITAGVQTEFSSAGTYGTAGGIGFVMGAGSAGIGRAVQGIRSYVARPPVVGRYGSLTLRMHPKAATPGVTPGKWGGLSVRNAIRSRIPWKYGNTSSSALGETDPLGNITIRRGLQGKQLFETIRHESVHRFLSPKSGPLQNLRAKIGIKSYNKSHLCRYIEETIAESYGTGSLIHGLRFPLQGGYRLSPVRIGDRTSTRLNSSIGQFSRMTSSA